MDYLVPDPVHGGAAVDLEAVVPELDGAAPLDALLAAAGLPLGGQGGGEQDGEQGGGGLHDGGRGTEPARLSPPH